MSNVGKNSMKRTGLERVVERDCDSMDGRPIVPHPDVATLLADHPVAKVLQRANDTICGNSAGQFQAASTGISSSFT